jgi:hypothetical protein
MVCLAILSCSFYFGYCMELILDLFLSQGIWDVEQDSLDENSCYLRVYINVAFSKRTIFRGKIHPLHPECSSAFQQLTQYCYWPV